MSSVIGVIFPKRLLLSRCLQCHLQVCNAPRHQDQILNVELVGIPNLNEMDGSRYQKGGGIGLNGTCLPQSKKIEYVFD